MVRRKHWLLDVCLRTAFSSAVGLSACLPGCASIWHKKELQRYETVATQGSRDTKEAKAKHAEALVIIEKGNPDKLHKAENLLNEALVEDVRYGPAHNSLGMLYFQQNKLYLAAWEFEYASKLMPSHPQPLNNLGLVYERAGKYDDAISYYTMALSRDEDDPEVIGNLVRARLDNGDKSQDVKSMISDLALHHPDPKWQEWARDQVALAKFDKDDTDLTNPWPRPAGMPEVLPAPIRDAEPAKTAEPLAPPKELKFPESIAPGERMP